MKRTAAAPVENGEDSPSVRLVLHTVDGVVPYLTPFLLQKHFPAPQPHFVLGIAARDTCIGPFFAERSRTTSGEGGEKSSSKPIAGYKFASEAYQPDAFLDANYPKLFVPSFDPIQDAMDSKQIKSVTSTSDGMLVWTPHHGRHHLSCGDFQELAKAVPSDMVVPLFDMALDSDSKKRRSNAVQRTTRWMDGFETGNGQQRVLQPVSLGGQPDRAPPSSSNPPKFSGVAVIGYHHVESRIERRKRLAECLRSHGDKRLSVVLHAGTMEEVVDAIAAGVDDVGCRLPTEWADSSRAFVISVSTWRSRKKSKASPGSLKEEDEVPLDANGCMSFADKRFATDKGPIQEGCRCLSCSKHSRAYIHHLVNVNELLAKILLFIHNLHQMVNLCRVATTARSENDLEAFCHFLYSELRIKPCSDYS